VEAVAVAAVAAGLLALVEQLRSFAPGQRMRLAGKAWRYWALRFSADAAFAVLIALVAYGAAGAALNKWWHGFAIALFSTSGLRSSFDPGDDTVGLYHRFDQFRQYISERIDNVTSVHVSGEMQRVREELSALGVEPEWIAERLRDFIPNRSALEEAEQTTELAGVEQHVCDDGVHDDTKLEVLLRDASRRRRACQGHTRARQAANAAGARKRHRGGILGLTLRGQLDLRSRSAGTVRATYR